MTINITKTLSDKDHKVQANLLVSTMIKFNEFEKLLDIFNTQVKLQDKKLSLESLVYKLGEIFQNHLRAYEYLKEIYPNGLNEFQEKINDCTYLNYLGKHRGDLYHNSLDVLPRIITSDFFEIKGNHFEGLRIKDNGCLLVKESLFKADANTQFAITSEGFFKIKNPNSKEESWESLEYPYIAKIDCSESLEKLQKSFEILKNEFFLIREKMKKIPEGQFKNQELFFNNIGSMSFFEQMGDDVKKYDLSGHKLEIEGFLSVSPIKK